METKISVVDMVYDGIAVVVEAVPLGEDGEGGQVHVEIHVRAG